MYIKLNLTNGQTVSAFVDEATVEYLNEVIIEEGCYDDESEITDYDYVDYANLMSGEFVFIFDKKYDLEKDVESFEVDRYAMESEEDKEKRMAKYRTVSQDAMDYALDFFHGSISKVFENERDVSCGSPRKSATKLRMARLNFFFCTETIQLSFPNFLDKNSS